MEIVEILANSVLLDQFYELYQKIFVDENERETRENIIKYLSLKDSSYYGSNSYHIFCSVEDKKIEGFLVGDYYSGPNSGVIEFVGVSPEYRDRHIAKMLIDHFTETISKEAQKKINGIFCEVDIKELSHPGHRDKTSLSFWKKLDFGVVELIYVQPSLSPGKKPVKDLVLLYRDIAGSGLEATQLLSFVESYMKYAMSIDAPYEKWEYQVVKGQTNHRKLIPIMTVDEFIKTGFTVFSNPVLDYIITFPLFPINDLIGRVEELTLEKATEIANIIFNKASSLPFSKEVSVEIQKGDGTQIKIFGNENFVHRMRDKRESYVSGEYLKSKLSIKGVIKAKEQWSIAVDLPTGSATSAKLQIWMDVDHLSMASLHFIAYYDGYYSTREMVALMDTGKINVLNESNNELFVNFINKITDLFLTSGIKNSEKISRIKPEIYPVSFSTTDRVFETIRTHIYAIINQDSSYNYASSRYVAKFFDENQSVIETVFVHYGRKAGAVIFGEEGYGIFEAVTGYSVSEIEAADPPELQENIRITILNEYISEVTALLHERLYLKRLESILSKGDVTLRGDEKKTMSYLADIEKLFYTGLEEFRGLSLYSYTELDYALKQARSDMGIKEELEATIAAVGSLSKKAELLYRIRNDSNTVLISYLLTLFTASALTVSLINFILPPTATLLEKILFIFGLPVAAIIILYAYSINRRKYN